LLHKAGDSGGIKVNAEIRSFGHGTRSFGRRRANEAWGSKAYVVGITGDGYVPVVEDYRSESGRSLVGLPSVVLPPRESLEGACRAVRAGLRREFGYDAGDVVALDGRPTPGFLLAPMLHPSGWRARVGFLPGVYEVPLRSVAEWLHLRRQAGALESRELRRGLRLAQEHFPAWARRRLGGALAVLKDRAENAVVSA
jgi:hypothetical protein